MLKYFHTLYFLRMHDDLHPIGRDNGDKQQNHTMRLISVQINVSGKPKAPRSRTKMHQVSPNYREQLTIPAKPLVGMAEYR